MNQPKKQDVGKRRGFLKKVGTLALAAGSAVIGCGFSSKTVAADEESAIAEYWRKKQKKLEAVEAESRKKDKAFGPPQPKYIYRGTDYTDSKATFYAPLMEECKYLPEFQSIFTEGTAGQYFKHTLKFGMKDIIKYHGHSCEALYYTAAICRLICDKLFADNVVDRTILRGMGGKSPCIADSLIYVTGGRLQFGDSQSRPQPWSCRGPPENRYTGNLDGGMEGWRSIMECHEDIRYPQQSQPIAVQKVVGMEV